MFGGIAFMPGGHMCCGVIGQDLVARLGEDGADAALDEPHTRPMDFTGRPMKGYAFVAPAGTVSDDALRDWVARTLAFVATLPPKTPPITMSASRWREMMASVSAGIDAEWGGRASARARLTWSAGRLALALIGVSSERPAARARPPRRPRGGRTAPCGRRSTITRRAWGRSGGESAAVLGLDELVAGALDHDRRRRRSRASRGRRRRSRRRPASCSPAYASRSLVLHVEREQAVLVGGVDVAGVERLRVALLRGRGAQQLREGHVGDRLHDRPREHLHEARLRALERRRSAGRRPPRPRARARARPAAAAPRRRARACRRRSGRRARRACTPSASISCRIVVSCSANGW